MNEYKKFSYYYDEIMNGLNYDLWYEFATPYMQKNKKILDLACGSGTFAIMLALAGYDVEGLDLSESIIEIAKEKTKVNHKFINYYVEDMTKFSLTNKYQTITCFFDSVNFLSSMNEVHNLFNRVYEHLEDDGYFIFDIFSPVMMEEYKGNDINEKYDSFNLSWKSTVSSKKIVHNITIKTKDESFKEKYSEYFYSYLDIIKDDRFKVVQVSGDFNEDLDMTQDERIIVVLQKVKQD